MAMRGEATQAFALRSPAPKRRHVGLDPGFIDEDRPPRIETGLPGPPALSSPRDVGTSLFKGEQCFFEPQPLVRPILPSIRAVIDTASD